MDLRLINFNYNNITNKDMKCIWKSASKIVFVSIAFTVCIAFLYSVVMHYTTIEVKDFMFLAGMAFAFYFTRDKGDNANTTSTTTSTTTSPS